MMLTFLRWPLLVLLFLGGCAVAQSPETVWRDLTGNNRQNPDLVADANQCDYEYAKMQAISPMDLSQGIAGILISGPGPRVWDACMRARGWRQLH